MAGGLAAGHIGFGGQDERPTSVADAGSGIGRAALALGADIAMAARERPQTAAAIVVRGVMGVLLGGGGQVPDQPTPI